MNQAGPADGQLLAVVGLETAMFGEAERLLLATPGIEVTTFRYRSGVEALRLVTREGTELVVLPFRGQQIWRYGVRGEPLTMRTHFRRAGSVHGVR